MNDSLHRRRLLAGVAGLAATGALVGCTGDDGDSGNGGDDDGGDGDDGSDGDGNGGSTGGTDTEAGSGDAADLREEYGLAELDYETEDRLNIFQWGDYWPDDTIGIFEDVSSGQ